MIDAPKYPDVRVRLIGEDGNGFAIVGRVQKAMRQAGISEDEIDLFRKEAFSGSHPHAGNENMWVRRGSYVHSIV
jgi:hypothetical protein